MDDSRFFSFGIAGLQVIPIFALTYLQNELSAWTIIGQSKLLNLAAMFASFSLLYTSTWPVGQAIGILITVLLTITLSMSIHYTYRDYTIDEGHFKIVRRTRYSV
jgi:ABC-type Fe3+-siderophore transport system permease subunit